VERGRLEDTVSEQIRWHATLENSEHPKDFPLIPLYKHRMMVSVPCSPGNPVLSMHGCYDNIVYGDNLWLWLKAEFDIPLASVPDEWLRLKRDWQQVPFWADLL
jgi:hypothetical protein